MKHDLTPPPIHVAEKDVKDIEFTKGPLTKTGIDLVYEVIEKIDDDSLMKFVDQVSYVQADSSAIITECVNRFGVKGSIQLAMLCGFRGTDISKIGQYKIHVHIPGYDHVHDVNDLVSSNLLSSSRKSGKGDMSMTLSKVTSAFAPIVLYMRYKANVVSQFVGLPGPLAFPGLGSIGLTEFGLAQYISFQKQFSSALKGEFKISIVGNIVRSSKILHDGKLKDEIVKKFPSYFAMNEKEHCTDVSKFA